MVGDILAAVRFATILPVGSGGAFHPRRVAVALPLAGLLIGLLLALFDRLALLLWSAPAVAALDVVFLAVVTGALHLDGLADTADGLYGGKSRETALAIMKDSRLGAMGVVALVCCFLIKSAGLAELAHARFWTLMLIPAYARAGSLWGFRFLSYGRKNEGTALSFFEEPLTLSDFRWLALLVILSAFTGRMLVLNCGFAVLTAAVLWFYKKKMNCITGDMLGAMIEVTEAGLLITMAVL